MAAPTLRDVAKRAGVSLTSASLALSGKGRISAAVRQSVREAARQLDYRSGARQEKAPAGSALGILHRPERSYEWNFVRPTILELERALVEKAHATVLLSVPGALDTEAALRRILDTGVRGVFALQNADPVLLERLGEHGRRVVLVNTSALQDRYPTVCVDDFQGAYEGTLHLLNQGHRDLVFVEYERPEAPNVVADRFIGFRKALDERRIAFAPEMRVTVPFMDTRKLGKRLAALFGRTRKPTAVFAHDDYLGLFVIDALGSLGLGVPEDVSLVAPGDVLDYELPHMPRITTMRIDTTLLGRLASRLMLESLERDTPEVQVLRVKEQLVRRESTRALRPGPAGGGA